MPGLTCNACNKEFNDDSEQKLHYKSEWHRYNLKRKVRIFKYFSHFCIFLYVYQFFIYIVRVSELNPLHRLLEFLMMFKKWVFRIIYICIRIIVNIF